MKQSPLTIKLMQEKILLSFQPHILLVDRQIPTMNSLDLCREFHNACNIPILMLSNDDNYRR